MEYVCQHTIAAWGRVGDPNAGIVAQDVLLAFAVLRRGEDPKSLSAVRVGIGCDGSGSKNGMEERNEMKQQCS